MLTCKHVSTQTEKEDSCKSMQTVRFYRFVLLIDGVHKCIQKLRIDTAPYFGVKSVHIFWVFELFWHPEGLTAAELASRSMISRSLVSREIDELHKDGYIEVHETARGKRKNYNSPITLTEKGKELAAKIMEEGLKVQNAASTDIAPEELSNFYTTLEKLHRNLCAVAAERENADGNASAE